MRGGEKGVWERGEEGEGPGRERGYLVGGRRVILNMYRSTDLKWNSASYFNM